MTIAITCASGQLGRLTIEHLRATAPAARLVALARSPERAAFDGVETRGFDYRDAAALAPALEGVTTLALISSGDFEGRVGQHLNVIEAAKAAGVRRVVYTSLLKADRSPLIVAGDHRETEAALRASGLGFTILRNGWYTENWTGSLPAAAAAGAIIGCAGSARVSPATRRDHAEALAAAVSGEGHEGATYELGGDAFTMADLAAELSRRVGKPVPYADLPKAEFEAALAGMGLPAGLVAVIADADAGAAGGWLLEEGGALARLIGRRPTPLSAAVAAALA